MFSKSLVLLGLIASTSAETIRGTKEIENDTDMIHHLDLELTIEGERQLFPLLPGTKCPTGHQCRVRSSISRTSGAQFAPMINSMKQNYKTTLAMAMDWEALNLNFETVVTSNNYCTRRAAMAKAAALAGGATMAMANAQAANAAETKEVLMGSDSGLLAFVPAKTSICKGDSVKWVNNKGGPHNVVFDEDAIPEGVDQEAISMDEQLGEEGDTFVMKFDTSGNYDYYCEPHRGAGMNGKLIVM